MARPARRRPASPGRRVSCADPDPARFLPGGIRHRKRDRAAAPGPVWDMDHPPARHPGRTVVSGHRRHRPAARRGRRCGDRHALPDPVPARPGVPRRRRLPAAPGVPDGCAHAPHGFARQERRPLHPGLRLLGPGGHVDPHPGEPARSLPGGGPLDAHPVFGAIGGGVRPGGGIRRPVGRGGHLRPQPVHDRPHRPRAQRHDARGVAGADPRDPALPHAVRPLRPGQGLVPCARVHGRGLAGA